MCSRHSFSSSNSTLYSTLPGPSHYWSVIIMCVHLNLLLTQSKCLTSLFRKKQTLIVMYFPTVNLTTTIMMSMFRKRNYSEKQMWLPFYKSFTCCLSASSIILFSIRTDKTTCFDVSFSFTCFVQVIFRHIRASGADMFFDGKDFLRFCLYKLCILTQSDYICLVFVWFLWYMFCNLLRHFFTDFFSVSLVLIDLKPMKNE